MPKNSARPCNVEWIRDIVRQCRAVAVPCFVKQVGRRVLADDWPGAPDYWTNVDGDAMGPVLRDAKGGNPDEWPEDLRVREFPSSGYPLHRPRGGPALTELFNDLRSKLKPPPQGRPNPIGLLRELREDD